MSVIKSQRSDSKMEFIHTARELQIYSIQKCFNFPKRNGFKYLKTRFYLLETGRVVRKIHKKSITRQRRKLKKFKALLDKGVMTYDDVRASWQSWKSYASTFSAWHTIQSMAKLYDSLFIDPWAATGQ